MSWEILFTMCILYLYNPVELFKASKGMFKEWVETNVPSLQADYNPNHGYEPYWPGGHWLYLEKELGPNETTTKTPLVCGEECNYLYRRIGKVCGRRVDNRDYQRCFAILGICLGWWYDEFFRGFYTFDSYCKFLDEQCRTDFRDRWFLVHEGACSHDINTYFKPLLTPGPLERLSSHFETLATNFHNAGLESPLRQRLGVSLPVGKNSPISLDGDMPQKLDDGDHSYSAPHLSQGPLRYTLPYTIKQYIHNFVRDIFLKSDENNNK